MAGSMRQQRECRALFPAVPDLIGDRYYLPRTNNARQVNVGFTLSPLRRIVTLLPSLASDENDPLLIHLVSPTADARNRAWQGTRSIWLAGEHTASWGSFELSEHAARPRWPCVGTSPLYSCPTLCFVHECKVHKPYAQKQMVQRGDDDDR